MVLIAQLAHSAPRPTMAVASNASIPSAANAFGEALFAELQRQSSKKGSAPPAALTISPVSIARALAMLLQGAAPGSPTQTQIATIVFGGANVDGASALTAFNSELAALAAAMEQGGSGSGSGSHQPTVADANSVWVRSGLQLQQEFKKTLEDVFRAEAEPITTAAAVNKWVSDATRGKITEIVDDGTLSMMALLLINAIYFKGTWQLQFDKNTTQPLHFNLLSGETSLSAMMYREFKNQELRNVSVARLDTPQLPAGSGAVACQLVRLPYQGDDYAAVAAMPAGDLSTSNGKLMLASSSDGGVPLAYTSALSACRSAVLGGLAGAAAAVGSAGAGSGAIAWQPSRSTIKLWLPRFELTYSATLNDALQAMGLAAPFRPGDLTRIAADAGGAPVTDLSVDSVLHKTYIKVDEEGTEAAAVTAIMMTRAALLPEPELLLRFDRPFVFAVVHVPTGTALFVSEVYKPEEWKG